MDRTRKIRLISNSFYNAGLERAKRRDLTGAVEYLKKCLETIDRAFDHDSKVEKLRTLYKELGNQKSVKDLMDTLKQTIKDYQRTLCKG